MTRPDKPSDGAVARAFYEVMQLAEDRAPQYTVAYNCILDRARELDAATTRDTQDLPAGALDSLQRMIDARTAEREKEL